MNSSVKQWIVGWFSLKPATEIHMLVCVLAWVLTLIIVFDAASISALIILPFVSFILLGAVIKVRQYRSLIYCLAGIFLSSLSIFLNGPDEKGQLISKDTYAELTGVLQEMDVRPNNSYKITIFETSFSQKELGVKNTRIRLFARTDVPSTLKIGDTISVKALLQSLNGAIVPGGYDFGKAALKQGIQISGYSISDIEIIQEEKEGSAGLSIIGWVNNVRLSLASKIRSSLPPEEASIALALTLGIKSDITSDVAHIMRDAGLSHLLAISGLHMGLIAFISFFVFETVFAGIPAIALRVMPRKLAVFPVWCICFAYLLLSGSSTATLRAFIMVSVALLAVLADRKVFTLRSVMLAAGIILFFSPGSLFTASFQLSFAATTGLVLFYARWPDIWREEHNGVHMRIIRYAALIGVTSAVAQISIAPFALYHFQAISVVSLLTNIVVLPIVSFLLMPLLMLFMLAVSAGFPMFLALPVQTVISVILSVASGFASFPLAVLRLQQLPDISFALILVALIALIVGWYRARPYIAATFIGAAVIVYSASHPADILISKTGGTVASYRDGVIFSSGGRQHSFRAEAWRQYWGINPVKVDEKLQGIKIGRNARYEIQPGLHLSKVFTLSHVRAGCSAGDIIILPRRYIRYCKGAKAIISFEDLKEKGPLGIKQPFLKNPEFIWANG